MRIAATLAEVLAFVGLSPQPGATAALLPSVHCRAIGKYRTAPLRKRRRVELLIEPTLCAFGYTDDLHGPMPVVAAPPHR